MDECAKEKYNKDIFRILCGDCFSGLYYMVSVDDDVIDEVIDYMKSVRKYCSCREAIFIAVATTQLLKRYKELRF